MAQVDVCPKCGADSGGDWSQCEGGCPMPMSPHFDPALVGIEKPVYPYKLVTAILLKWSDETEWKVLRTVSADDAATSLALAQTEAVKCVGYCSATAEVKLGKARLYPDGRKEVEDDDVP